VGIQKPVEFPQIIYNTDDHTPIPLTFFLNNNLRSIHDERALLPTVKSNPLPGESKGSYILDVVKLSSRFGDDASMDFSQWSESSLNFVHFQASRDKDGDLGPYASFWKLHRAFFDSQEDKIEMFPFWKEVERDLRRQYISQPTKFDVQYYVTKYDRA
ncbi:hypothetical protein C8J56DRAFT_739521, partial [Mycena floridula]